MENTFSTSGDYISGRTAKNIQALLPGLPSSEARVAQYILLNLERIAYETGASIAEKALVSPITVSRFLKRAGYKGIVELKQEVMQDETLAQDRAGYPTLTDEGLKSTFNKDLQILVDLFSQFQTDTWLGLVNCVTAASQVYVSGFQTVRGIAEDFTRRLALARPEVRYLSAHESMLGEWLGDNHPSQAGSKVLVLIDVVPYAQEGKKLCEIAAAKGIKVVIITDEFCYWAREFTPHIIHAKSKTGLFLESTWGLVLATNMLCDQVARRNPDSRQRSKDWLELAQYLNLF
ncbi:MurR/RpiR family transcriptional regulator [Pseudomaricurvus sp. HS19]|uniref:MurR/RpiR family transcriptional regulator n=1 Tax=Pseudomaricurvus sp. HS19 TaxID=2692626 RepID=UPI00136AC126|nr:MurR/RpiR family transcriptional regulator [Pseudomaricurvus sp. HS19]MYM61807.1 MurR/RpiR family transcriptional regulator [Pseudomaricurvus sp. HS19]